MAWIACSFFKASKFSFDIDPHQLDGEFILDKARLTWDVGPLIIVEFNYAILPKDSVVGLFLSFFIFS